MTSANSDPAGPPNGESDGESGRIPYLIGSADPALLSRVTDQLEQVPDNGITVRRVLRGATGVSGLVVETTPERAARLRDEYGPALVVEPDRPLDPLPPVTPTEP